MIELNKIYNEDCLEGMKLIDDKSVDMILCDLPYGTTQCKWDTIIPFKPIWEQYNRIVKDKGAIVLFGAEPFSSTLRMSNIKYYKYDWKWVKQRGTGHLNAKRQPMRNNEDILVFYKNQCLYNPQGIIEGKFNNNRPAKGKESSKLYNKENTIPVSTKGNYPLNTLYFDKICINQLHPTQKPVELCEYLIRTYTNENELVLDNCIGSGTTAIACINTNRNYIGFELDSTYFDLANKRIEEHINC